MVVMRWVGLSGFLLVPSLITSQDVPDPYADTAKKAAHFLLSQQTAEGHFNIGNVREKHYNGLYSVVGLAILSETGFTPEMEKLARYIMKNQEQDGAFLTAQGDNTYKVSFEHGWVTIFLLEIYLEDKEGKIKLDGGFKNELKTSINKAMKFVMGTQDPSGVWSYVYGGKQFPQNYKESAVNLGMLQALAMAKAAGLDSNEQTIKAGIAFLRANWKNGGIVNGQLEQNPSPHLTPGILATLLWLKSYGGSDLLTSGLAYIKQRETSPYFTQWKYDEWDTLPKNLLEQAKMLVERRQMFGLFHTCLYWKRAGDEKKFAEMHKKSCELLLKNTSGDAQWNSTIGPCGATAFALLTFNLAKKDSLVFFRGDILKKPAAAPAKPKPAAAGKK
jgi:hypothetical protein